MGNVHLFGIRHHGPGSAHSLVAALTALQPDALLVEGPPDAESVLPLAVHAKMTPPVAMLIYAPDEPKKAVYYPFAVFSPEWQAIRYGLLNHIPVRFMDLAQTYQLALEKPEDEPDQSTQEQKPPEALSDAEKIRRDPLGALAEAAGYQDGERWWEHMVEQRQDSTNLFEAVLEAMTALRETTDDMTDQREILREAAMRNAIRAVQKDGFERIAVVCGAWHTPALVSLPPATHDHALLKGLKKIKVTATWIPWTHGRLTMWSGYGAGIWSPGWYQHLWECTSDIGIGWLTKTAHLLREQDYDASTAQIIDAVRLSETLAAMRDRPMPGLPEFSEATQSILCFGNDKPMQLIHQKLIVGETMGSVPDETPMIPIQQDLLREQKRLLMRPEAAESVLSLDLRKPTHLERSHLLHRLELLGIPWGKKEQVRGKQGTFHEVWKLKWHPEFVIRLIEKSAWGNTVYDAATAFAQHTADEAEHLPDLTQLINLVILSDLSQAIDHVVRRLQALSALTEDIKQLMASLPPLADVFSYGNVRGTDAQMIGTVIDGIVARVWVGLPGACMMLDDEAAAELFKVMRNFNSAIRILNRPEYMDTWHSVLTKLLDQSNTHGLLKGRSCRILLDDHYLIPSETARYMRLEVASVQKPESAAAWLEGFLQGSGTVLIHDLTLLEIIDEWVIALGEELFITLLPLLRRTFSTFTDPERRQIGEIVRGKKLKTENAVETAQLDERYMGDVLAIISQLMGLEIHD